MKQIVVSIMLILMICVLASGQEKKKSASLSNEDFPKAKAPNMATKLTEDDLYVLTHSGLIRDYELESGQIRGIQLQFQYYDLLLIPEKDRVKNNYRPRMDKLMENLRNAPYENVTKQDLIDLVYRNRFVILRGNYEIRAEILKRAQAALEEARKGKSQTVIFDTEARMKEAEQELKKVEAQIADLRHEGRERGVGDRAFKLLAEK